MKCVKNKNDGNIRRVENDKATALVKLGAWNYCPKSEWKAVKGISEAAIPLEKKVKKDKTNKKSKKGKQEEIVSDKIEVVRTPVPEPVIDVPMPATKAKQATAKYEKAPKEE